MWGVVLGVSDFGLGVAGVEACGCRVSGFGFAHSDQGFRVETVKIYDL